MVKLPQGRTERVGCALSVAMVAAPFLALLYGPDAGLAVAAAALSATTFLAWDAARAHRGQDKDRTRRMAIAAGINAVLAIAVVALLASRLLGP